MRTPVLLVTIFLIGCLGFGAACGSRKEHEPIDKLPNPTPASSSPNSGANGSNLAPDAVFDSLDGKKVSFSSFRGQVVLLNFWATWCIPCRAEIPTFNAIQKDYAARGVKVVGVLAYDPDADLASFDIKQDYTVLRGADDEVAKFEIERALPITLVIDREGRIQKRFRGAQEREVFEAALKPLLGEGAKPATP